MIKRMEDKRPYVLLSNDAAGWRWTRGYVENVADAIALAATDERTKNQIYNVGERDALTEKQWIELLAEETGWNGEILVLERDLMKELLEGEFVLSQDIFVDTSKIRNELNFTETVSRTEAIKRTIAWERENPPDTISAKDFDYETEDKIVR